jgi:hypothetical protein
MPPGLGKSQSLQVKAAGPTPRREDGRVYFDDPDGIECQVASGDTRVNGN